MNEIHHIMFAFCNTQRDFKIIVAFLDHPVRANGGPFFVPTVVNILEELRGRLLILSVDKLRPLSYKPGVLRLGGPGDTHQVTFEWGCENRLTMF